MGPASLRALCVPVLQPLGARIGPLPADSARRSLLLSWRVNHSDLVANVYEIQILRAGSHTVVYNVSRLLKDL